IKKTRVTEPTEAETNSLLLEPNYLFSETQTTSLYPRRPESLQVKLSQRVWFSYMSQNMSRPI
ncbi:unnamed protein product, partial [Gulo gulo]